MRFSIAPLMAALFSHYAVPQISKAWKKVSIAEGTTACGPGQKGGVPYPQYKGLDKCCKEHDDEWSGANPVDYLIPTSRRIKNADRKLMECAKKQPGVQSRRVEGWMSRRLKYERTMSEALERGAKEAYERERRSLDAVDRIFRGEADPTNKVQQPPQQPQQQQSQEQQRQPIMVTCPACNGVGSCRITSRTVKGPHGNPTVERPAGGDRTIYCENCRGTGRVQARY